MLKKNQIISVPEADKIFRHIDKKIKKQDNYFAKVNKVTHEIFIIHGIENDFIPKEYIRIKDILGVSLGHYKNKNGKWFNNVSVFIEYDHLKYNKEVKTITKKTVSKENDNEFVINNNGSFDEIDPNLLDF